MLALLTEAIRLALKARRWPLAPMVCIGAMSAAARYCTTRQLNAHGTGVERKLCYPWHPWAGLKVHVSTSPHLVRFHERIRLAGRLIEDDALNAILDRVEASSRADWLGR